MVEILVGDIFESGAQTLVNTVNCVGVMGKGVALQFKERFQAMFKDYQARCRHGEVRLGKPYLYTSLVHPWVLNFPTKDHWRSVTKLDDIVRGLEYVVKHYKQWGITSLAVPPLGCGEGRLDWRIVGPTLYRYLSQLDIPVRMYAPFGTKPEELRTEFLQGRVSLTPEASRAMRPRRVNVAWLVVMEILHRIEQEPYHWPVGRTIFQKIVFVASNEGVPIDLRYK
ncbi:MAG: macro domain-containing protein, partial [Thermodesulfobacteriota bacterium]